MADTSVRSEISAEMEHMEVAIRGRNGALPEMDKHLPVVEIQPFRRHVWRREKSLPEFYDKPRTANGQGYLDRSLQFESENDEDATVQDGSVAATVISKYLERQRVSRNGCRLTDVTGPRYRIKIHPSVDFSYNCRPQKAGGLIPEFIPRAERTKTTFMDAKKDDEPQRQFSLTKPPVSNDVPVFRHAMKVNGGRVNHSSEMTRTQLSYLNPLYGNADSKRNNKKTDRPALSSIGSMRKTSENGSCEDLHQYSASSESSSVAGDVGRPRGRVPMRLVHNNGFGKPESNKQSVNVSIGGIRNALQVLSEFGPMTKLEKQLTFEMEVSMEKCRRHLELPPPDSVPQISQTINPNMFYDVNKPMRLTKGEVMLRKGRDLNSRRTSRRHTRGKQAPPVHFNRNVRQVEAFEMDSNMNNMDTLDNAFHNGIFDRMSDSSPRSIHYPNHVYPFSRVDPLGAIVPKGDNSNKSPTTDTSTIMADSIPRGLTGSDVRMDDVHSSDVITPMTSPHASELSPRMSMYITEPSDGPNDLVMSLDSRIMRRVESQFTKAHFKPCNNVEMKDGSKGSESGSIRAIT